MTLRWIAPSTASGLRPLWAHTRVHTETGLGPGERASVILLLRSSSRLLGCPRFLGTGQRSTMWCRGGERRGRREDLERESKVACSFLAGQGRELPKPACSLPSRAVRGPCPSPQMKSMGGKGTLGVKKQGSHKSCDTSCVDPGSTCDLSVRR